MSFFSEGLNKRYLWATEQLYHSFAWAYENVAWLVSFGYSFRWRMDVYEYISLGQSLEVGFGSGELMIEQENFACACL